MSVVDESADLALTELEGDIIMALKEQEMHKLPSLQLLDSQPQITWEMRLQLLEFLAQAQAALDLQSETLALAVSVLDRYMSKRIVFTRHYQLLGCVCLWLAAKSCDSKQRVPTTATLSYLCAGSYAESMFCEMETHVLSTLDWSIIAPTTDDFINMNVKEVAHSMQGRFTKADYITVRKMAHYVCECSLFTRDTVGIRPSVVAASAVALSVIVIDVLESRRWPSVFPLGCAKECFDALAALIASPPTECAMRYANDDQCAVSPRFAQFFASVSDLQGDQCGSGSFDNTPLGHVPTTPLRLRRVSSISGSPLSLFDDDLISPTGSVSPSQTYFVPLTPDEQYVEYHRAIAFASSKPTAKLT